MTPKALPERYIAEHYNGRIFRCYAVYLRNRYGIEIFQRICGLIGVDEELLVNETSWFSNSFFLKFLDLMKLETGDSRVSEKAGEIFVNPEVVSPLEYASLASKLSPYLVLRFLPIHYRKYNRLNHVIMTYCKPGKFKFVARPSTSIVAPPEVCGSTISMVGSIKNLFDLDFVQVVESKCIHKGGDECTFEVSYSGKGLWFKRIFSLISIGVTVIGLTFSLGRKVKDNLGFPESGYVVVGICGMLASVILIMLINNLRKTSLLSFYFQQANEISNSLSSERAARAKEIARVQLAHEVAHDIRSPIAALEVAAELENSVEKAELERKALARIREITSLLVGISNPIEPEQLLVRSLLRDILVEKEFELKRRVAPPALELKWSSGDIYILGHKMKFYRAVSNILNNAVEAVKSNGHVEINLLADESDVIITVSDNGIGISAHTIQSVGRRGFTSGKQSGSGLGFFLATEYVEEMNGRLTLESEEGKGTTVTFKFPRR